MSSYSRTPLGPFRGLLAAFGSHPIAEAVVTRNYYSEINLHLVWHTKNSSPPLTPTVEPLVHRFLRQRLINAERLFVHEIGGIETHVHVVVTVPPTVRPSELVGELKGAVSHHVNHQTGSREAVLQWQTGYGVVSFGRGDLDWVSPRNPT